MRIHFFSSFFQVVFERGLRNCTTLSFIRDFYASLELSFSWGFFDISRRLDYVLRNHKKNSGTHRFWRRNKDKERGQGGRQPEGSFYQGYRWVWEEVL